MAVHALVHNVVLLGTVFLPQVSFKSVMADFKEKTGILSGLKEILLRCFSSHYFPMHNRHQSVNQFLPVLKWKMIVITFVIYNFFWYKRILKHSAHYDSL